ncbi:MAG: 50S ribosomal protein L23 [Patescibacteria group bacterium]|jgi:large subunit ribosomal protein L23
MASALFGKQEPASAKEAADKEKKAVKKADKKPASVSNAPAKDEKEKTSMKDLYSGAAAKESQGAKPGEKRKLGQAYRVLVKPLVTEKASILGSGNKYLFSVARHTNKIEVAKAIFEVYGIKPIKVNMINNMGKKVRYGRISGERKSWKKAIVTLPEGKSINVYEGV